MAARGEGGEAESGRMRWEPGLSDPRAIQGAAEPWASPGFSPGLRPRPPRGCPEAAGTREVSPSDKEALGWESIANVNRKSSKPQTTGSEDMASICTRSPAHGCPREAGGPGSAPEGPDAHAIRALGCGAAGATPAAALAAHRCAFVLEDQPEPDSHARSQPGEQGGWGGLGRPGRMWGRVTAKPRRADAGLVTGTPGGGP